VKHLLLFALLALPAAAQESPEEKPPPEPVRADPISHQVQLIGGSVLVGQVEPRMWKVLTRFGTLTVPVEAIKKVRFGRKSQPERYAQVLALIDDLASANPDRRNHAMAGLREEGAYAAPELQRAAKGHADPEVRRLSQEVFEKLEVEESDFVPDDDQVETTLFTVSGAVTLKSFKVTVAELGALDVQRRDIVSVRLFQRARTRKFTLTGQHTMAGKWLDTKLQIKKGVRLRISASGTIHFPRWGNNVMNPDGSPNMGNINGIWIGALVGRVGQTGSMFKIGRSYFGVPEGKGTLQICVMINATGQPSTGHFVVLIEEQ